MGETELVWVKQGVLVEEKGQACRATVPVTSLVMGSRRATGRNRFAVFGEGSHHTLA